MNWRDFVIGLVAGWGSALALRVFLMFFYAIKDEKGKLR